MISSCPICGHQVLTAELERHANRHFEDDEVQRDMELAQLAMVAELSTVVKCPFDAIEIINRQKAAIRRYGLNISKLHRLPVPRPGQV